jgi:murein DD-endopeptidase MepM/ murein hydrolase activator NlpD
MIPLLLFLVGLPPQLHRVVDMNVGESTTVVLHGGATAKLRLLDRNEVRDTVRNAVRQARIRMEINGQEADLECANYRLPVSVAGVQVDCTVTRGYLNNSRSNPWGLEKDARIRLWPAGSPLLAPGTYRYPVKQGWFASDTQMANQPSFVDGSEIPPARKIYYHHGLDIGGAEGLVQVISATDGLVVTRGNLAIPGYEKSPYTELNYDGVIVRDDRGWFHWYFHLSSIDADVKLGERIRIGENIGVIGKEGHAGCWSHLHYEIRSEQPSGKAGIEEGYAFLWEAYQREYAPEIIAVARPHALVWVGEPAVLDGSRSWSRYGKIAKYEWTLGDGETAVGPTVTRTYQRPGTYSEILKVTDGQGRTAYDFAVVQVVDRERASARRDEEHPPTINAAYAPASGLRAGEPVTFLVRTCRTAEGHETWNFGDGSRPVVVTSDGCAKPRSKEGYARTEHTYRTTGDYIVQVERSNSRGEKAVAHLHVRVDPATKK